MARLATQTIRAGGRTTLLERTQTTMPGHAPESLQDARHTCRCNAQLRMAHGEWKRHLYVAHGLSDGDPETVCRPHFEPVA